MCQSTQNLRFLSINYSTKDVDPSRKRRTNALIKSQIYDIVIYGHTHDPVVEKQGQNLIIDPGECGGWFRGRSTAALADLDQITAEIIQLS